MEENSKKKLVKSLLPELGCMVLAVLGFWGLTVSGVLVQTQDRLLCHLVLVVLGIGIVGFSLRGGLIRTELDYDNGQHILRFWLFFTAGLAIAFVCAFLPEAAWPFLPVFVFLGLFSNFSTGVLAGIVLLAIPAGLTGSGIEVYLLYVISGVFGAALFQKLKNGFRTAVPMILSLGCLLVCLTAGTVLIVNARPGLEYFVIPVANLIVSGIMLFCILKYFFAKTIYLYRDNYLELNDPENAILSELKEKNRSAYMKNVHTAYFCERIAMKLNMSPETLKCAAYYHNMEELPGLEGKHFFPPEVIRILEDYKNGKKAIRYKETAVLTASDDVIRAVLHLLEEKGDKPIDYDKVIDHIFQRYYETGKFNQCDISVRELQMMKRIFKEEKLYYDFLH